MKQLISNKDILKRIKSIAKDITQEHIEDSTPVVMICVLNGGFMFYTHLVENIPLSVECDFIRVKSYNGKKQGKIQITKDIETNIKGKHVYIVDDFLDTGNTIQYIMDLLTPRKPKSLNLVTLLRRDDSFIFNSYYNSMFYWYYGFEIKDEWVTGFGLDGGKGYYRNLNSIWSI